MAPVKYKCDSNNLRGIFDRSKILLTEKLTNGALVTPTPGIWGRPHKWPLSVAKDTTQCRASTASLKGNMGITPSFINYIMENKICYMSCLVQPNFFKYLGILWSIRIKMLFLKYVMMHFAKYQIWPLSSCQLVGLTLWGQVMHICIGKLIIIGSDDALLPGQHQAIIWTNIVNWTLQNRIQWNFNQNGCIFIQGNAFKIHLENGGRHVSASMC